MTSYCLPIIEKSSRSVRTKIKESTDYAFFEVWLDYIKDLTVDLIVSLTDQYPGRILFLFRRQNLDPTEMPFSTRQALMEALNERQAFLDLDIRTQSDELAFVKSERLQIPLILSYHNYSLTPSEKELWKVITEMEPYYPEIFKVSTLCRDNHDALRLIALLLRLNSEGKKHIILGMGAPGKVLRVFGTLWGNEMIFAPKKLEHSSAPGQLSIKQLKTIFKELT